MIEDHYYVFGMQKGVPRWTCLEAGTKAKCLVYIKSIGGYDTYDSWLVIKGTPVSVVRASNGIEAAWQI